MLFEQRTNDILYEFESLKYFSYTLEFMGYEVYCQAQLIFIFTEDLTKRRDIDVLSEDVSRGPDKQRH